MNGGQRSHSHAATSSIWICNPEPSEANFQSTLKKVQRAHLRHQGQFLNSDLQRDTSRERREASPENQTLESSYLICGHMPSSFGSDLSLQASPLQPSAQ